VESENGQHVRNKILMLDSVIRQYKANGKMVYKKLSGRPCVQPCPHVKRVYRKSCCNYRSCQDQLTVREKPIYLFDELIRCQHCIRSKESTTKQAYVWEIINAKQWAKFVIKFINKFSFI